MTVGILVFSILMLGGFVGGRVFMPEKQEHTSARHLKVFVCWLVSAAGLIGLIAIAALSFSGSFIGVVLQRGELIEFLALVTGVPVALAGSTYAILLAYKSIRLSESEQGRQQREEEAKQNEEFDRRVGQASSDFLELSARLDNLNVVSSSLLARSLTEMAGVMLAERGDASALQRAMERLDQSAANYAGAFAALGNHVGTMLRRPTTSWLLEYRLSSVSLAATDVLDKVETRKIWKFHEAEGLDFFAYGHSGTGHDRAYDFLRSLQLLGMQASRLRGLDLIQMALHAALNTPVSDLGEQKVVDVPPVEKFGEVFFQSYLSAPVRLQDRAFDLHWPLRMLYDIHVQAGSEHFPVPSGPWRLLSAGTVLLSDLVKLLPEKRHIEEFLRGERGQRALGYPQGPWLDARLEQLAFPEKRSSSAAALTWAGETDKSLRDSGFPGLKYDAHQGVRAILEAARAGAPTYPAWRAMVRRHLVDDLLEHHILQVSRNRPGATESAAALDALGKQRAVVESLRNLAVGGGERDSTALRWFLLAARSRPDDADAHGYRSQVVELARKLAAQGEIDEEQAHAYNLESRTGYRPHPAAEAASEGGALPESAQAVARWIEGQFWSYPPVDLIEATGTSRLLPEELGALDGLMLAFLVRTGADLDAFGLVLDPTALCGCRIAPDFPEGAPRLDWDRFVIDFHALVARLPVSGPDRGSLDLSTEWTAFKAWLGQGGLAPWIQRGGT